MIFVSELNESHLIRARIIDAIFCSELETGAVPSSRELAHAIRGALWKYRSWNGCTRVVVAVFADDPTAATQREAWSEQLARTALSDPDTRRAVEHRE